MAENPRNQRPMLDAGDDTRPATTLRADFDVDWNHPFRAPHPAHGGVWFVRVDLAAGLGSGRVREQSGSAGHLGDQVRCFNEMGWPRRLPICPVTNHS